MKLRRLPASAWRRLRRALGVPLDRVDYAVQQFGAAHPDAVFLQIGACDGVALDPLHTQIARRRWSGVMVEPVPYVFERLSERYGAHPRVRLENLAIANEPGSRPFYHLSEAAPDDPVWPWYHALGSFEREVVLKHRHLIPDIDERLVETEVPCVTVAQLCEKHELEQLDMLLIDTEGYDWEVLRSVELGRLSPRLIVYEHDHLSAADREQARTHLADAGYATFEDGLNTAALAWQPAAAPDRLRSYFLRQRGVRAPTPAAAQRGP